MQTTIKRTLGLAAATGGLLIGGLIAATPAQAGGEVMVSGDTKSECQAVLKASMDESEDLGNRVTDVTPCAYYAPQSDWHASYGVTTAR